MDAFVRPSSYIVAKFIYSKGHTDIIYYMRANLHLHEPLW